MKKTWKHTEPADLDLSGAISNGDLGLGEANSETIVYMPSEFTNGMDIGTGSRTWSDTAIILGSGPGSEAGSGS